MKGLDVLGLGSQYFPLDDLKRLIPQGYAIGCFDQTFGPVVPKLRTLLDTGKIQAVRVQMPWEDHALTHIDVISRRAPFYEQLAHDYPAVKIYISHSCEHNSQDRNGIRALVLAIRIHAPHCTPVNNPGTGIKVGLCINENHDPDHAWDQPYITSMDGDAAGAGLWNIDCKVWNKTHHAALMRLGWFPELNGRASNETAPPAPPMERKKFATAEQIQTAIDYLEGK